MEKIGFYYQAYDKPNITNLVLKNVRTHFPTAPIFLCSDAGEDMSHLSKIFNCEYHYYKQNIGGSVGQPIDYYLYMERLKNSLAFDTKYTILLEDDVCCRKTIEFWPSTTAAGPIGNQWSLAFQQLVLQEDKITRISKDLNFQRSGYLYYGNCGGSIFLTKAMTNALAYVTPDLYELASSADWRFRSCIDAFITGTLQLAGHDYSIWLEHSEEQLNKFSPLGITAFDHQHKNWSS